MSDSKTIEQYAEKYQKKYFMSENKTYDDIKNAVIAGAAKQKELDAQEIEDAKLDFKRVIERQKPTILSIAAQLLTHQVSDNPDDYPKKFPKWVLKYIEKHNERQRDWATELRNIHDEKLMEGK